MDNNQQPGNGPNNGSNNNNGKPSKNGQTIMIFLVVTLIALVGMSISIIC